MTLTASLTLSPSPDARPDLLATAAMRALTREHPLPPRWGVAKTLVLGALTFGVLPLYAWPKSFRSAATIERVQFWHLAEWLRLRGGHPGADDLPVAASRIGFRPILWAASMLCVALAAAVFAYQANRFGFDLRDLRATTYGLGRVPPRHLPSDLARQLFATWNVGLCLAYLLYWFHLHLHHADVRRFVCAFNTLSGREGIGPVAIRPLGLGLRPFWLLGAIVLVSVGAVWGIPMCLAGALHGRWRRDGRAVRAGLADSLRQMLLLRRPAVSVSRPVHLGDFCPNDLCRNRVPPLARFCPRCGLHASSSPPLDLAEVSQVA